MPTSPKGLIRKRPAIEHIAERFIAQRRFEADGPLLIRNEDC